MDKSQIQKIFTQSFSLDNWLDLLRDVFEVNQVLAQPKSIDLPTNDKAKAAYELGSFTTSDDRIIGLYKVDLNPDVWLERNKVGIRELLRNVYKYDVDGALIVFEQEEKWRLSFVSEIKVLNDEGEVVKQATEPKRYTYLLGEGEKVLTPSIQISRLVGKDISLDDILEAFSVEALNEEFYKIVARQFYKLVGGTLGKGRKAKIYEPVLKLPGLNPDENRKIYQEFSVRLIGRIVFCWFLKVKKSKDKKALLPETLLSSKAVNNYNNYYHYILEKIFFQVLNTPIKNRVEGLPEGSEDIPFLNGGLFENDHEDFYKFNITTGLSEHINTLNIPDSWFFEFFQELEKYNFTIDENSVTDVEVSIDPEMLGRIFENLLAEIDPDTEETARKATGSFYTPREIVDYMSTESLVRYLHNKTQVREDRLRPLFRMTDAERPGFSNQERHQILEALDEVKILDPACGSGAFPIGVLQKIVGALQKIDEGAEWWIEKRVSEIPDSTARNAARTKFENNREYARKIGIIQNSLYGVDIQPIAAEISKLRCFLTLIVDENIDENKENRGVEHLPNLEFKFVTADTLRGLPEESIQHDAFGHFDELKKLKGFRIDYLQSHGEDKKNIKAQFLNTQASISKTQKTVSGNELSRAYLISNWDPFSHKKVSWFDSEWMFGISSFDIVIGNPPYLRLQGVKKSDPELIPLAKKNYRAAEKGNWDLYVLFIERGYQLLSTEGVLSYIQPHKFLQAEFGVGIRGFIAEEQSLMKIVHFGAEQIFNAASNYTCLLFLERQSRNKFEFIDASSRAAWKRAIQQIEGFKLPQPKGDYKWNFNNPETQKILDLINEHKDTLNDITRKIFQGIATSADKVFVLEKKKDCGDKLLLYSNEMDEKVEIEKGILKPFLVGKDVRRYKEPNPKNYIIFPYKVTAKNFDLYDHEFIRENFPKCWDYLLRNKSVLEQRESGRFKKTWWQFSRPQNMTEFTKEKIMTRDIASSCEFTLDNNQNYHTTTIYSFIFKEGVKEGREYWLGLLNSKVLWFFLQATGNVLRGNYFRFKTKYLYPFPVPRIDFDNKLDLYSYNSIQTLVSYILHLNSIEEQVNAHVPNSHISEKLEDVIDALVMELYFSDDFNSANIEFARYAARDFKPIDGVTDKGKILDIIHSAYQKLRERENEIRNNLKLMDIKLSDIVGPIKAST